MSKALQITWVGVIINLCLAILKCGIGYIANSRALIGDGLHSLMDLSTDMVALFGIKMSDKPKDDNHLYGHHKFGSFSTLLISLAIIGFCIVLIIQSIVALFKDTGATPGWEAMIVAAISIIAKEALYWRTRKVARALKSRLLLANAWHHRSDAFSSILVFIAIAVAHYGGEAWLFLDSVMGLFMGLYLGFQALKFFKSATQDLLDTAPETEIINDIREHILPTPGVIAYHQFRVRPVGDLFEVDLHLQVDPHLTVEAGHAIASEVKKNILDQHQEVLEVLVHIEPATPRHLQPAGIHGRDE